MSRCFAVALLGAASWLATPPTRAAAPEGDTKAAAVTEAEVVEQALDNPGLARVLGGRMEAAEAQVKLAGRWTNPQLSYMREQVLGSDPAGEDYLTLSQQFELGGSRWMARKAAKEQIEAQRWGNEATKADLVAVVRHAYAHTLYAQERVAVLQAWKARVEAAVAATRAREAAGDMSRLEASRFEQELRLLDARIATTESQRVQAWAEMRAMIDGKRGGRPARVAGPLLPAAAPTDPTSPPSEIPAQRALLAKENAADKAYRAGLRRLVPRLTLTGGYKGVDTPTGRIPGFTVGASLALPLGDRGQVQRRQADAQRNQARGQFQLGAQRIEAREGELRARHELLMGGRSGDGVDEELPALAELAYRGGELGVVGLLDAYRGAYEAQNAALDLALEIRAVHIELDRLRGRTEL